jgi:uncharacterized membrane protein
MNARLAILLALFAAFTGWTGYLVATQGYTGFIDLALTDVWGAQLLIDLSIALVLFTAWMIPDARERAIPWLPYGLAILTLGSIGALGYLVHREVKVLRRGGAQGDGLPAAA